MPTLDLFPSTKTRRPRRVLAHMIDVGDQRIMSTDHIKMIIDAKADMRSFRCTPAAFLRVGARLAEWLWLCMFCCAFFTVPGLALIGDWPTVVMNTCIAVVALLTRDWLRDWRKRRVV